MPDTSLMFFPEWRRIVILPNGENAGLDSQWYRDKSTAASMLNAEYPEPSRTGFRFLLQTRWVSEARTDAPDAA